MGEATCGRYVVDAARKAPWKSLTTAPVAPEIESRWKEASTFNFT
jgi:hypothetical protein